jgi:hypothetical protein
LILLFNFTSLRNFGANTADTKIESAPRGVTRAAGAKA